MAMAIASEGGTVLAVDRADFVHEVVTEITDAGGKAAGFRPISRPLRAPRPWLPNAWPGSSVSTC